ncbi:MAG: UDP-2,4-diacetamido-2,4,6-trideoxy-beta-L-altropyranose hydrolase [Pseudomonadota bacterium]
MTRSVVVRADGDSRIGLGHVLRSMAVADELARTGACVTYLCRRLSPWAAAQLEERGFRVEMVDLDEASEQTDDAIASIAAVERAGADTVLLDHYGLTKAWTQKVRAHSQVLIAAFDDLAADTRTVDVLIDGSPGRLAADYQGLIPEQAVCLVGPAYAPLRPEFSLAREARRGAPNDICRVAISMGGVDPDGVTLTCLDALDGRADLDLTVILSSDAAKLGATKARVARMKTPTRLLLDRTDMAAVLKDMDLVIGAGGTSSLERCALGLPTVLAVLADNQSFNAKQLAQAGAVAILPDLSAEAIRQTVEPLLEDPDERARMGQNAAQLCDGLGAPRVGYAIVAQQSKVTLRPVTPNDMHVIHDWQSEPQARQFSRNTTVPSIEEHSAWFKARLARLDRDPFHIILHEGKPAGFIRLDHTDAPDTWEVSVLVSQTYQRRGIARAALSLLRLMHPKPNIVAEVDPRNTPSQRVFETTGYRRMAPHRFRSAGWLEIAEKH